VSGRVVGLCLLLTHVLTTSLCAQARTFLEVEWELEWQLPPLLESPIHAPALLATLGDASVVTVDYADNTIRRIDSDGRLRWVFGRRGKGPREFMNPTGLTVGADGNIYVTDAPNRRVTVLSPAGELVHVLPVGDVSRVAVTKEGELLALGAVSGPLVLHLGADGSRRGAFSAAAFDESLSGHAREGIVSGGRWTDTFLVAFLHSGYLAPVHGDVGGYEAQLMPSVEPFEFGRLVSWSTADGRGVISRLDPNVPDGAKWLDHDGTYFYVGFEGSGDHGDRLVDLYTVGDARYAGSLRLPEATAWGAVFSDGRIAALVYEPIPHLKVWRWSRCQDVCPSPATHSHNLPNEERNDDDRSGT
jgi:hypothetical protein